MDEAGLNDSSNDFSSLLLAKNIIKKEEPKVVLSNKQKILRFLKEIFNWATIFKVVKYFGQSSFLIIPLQTKFNRNYRDYLNTIVYRRLPEITINTQ